MASAHQPPTHPTSLIVSRPLTLWGLYQKTRDGPNEISKRRSIPQEVWAMVMVHLPSLTGRYAAQALCFGLTEPHKIHSSIWDKIWREDSNWPSFAESLGLNLALLGDDLHILAEDPSKPAYLALVTGDLSGDIRYRKTDFLSSLRPHSWNDRTEIVFRDSNITLNVGDALFNPEFVTLTPEKLFSCQHDALRSASLYWKDSRHSIRTIGPGDIVGIGGRAAALEDVAFICDVTLTHPPEMMLEHRYRQSFRHPSCPKVRPMFSPSQNGDEGSLLGWEVDED